MYHGTDIPNIKEFEYAENSTIGDNAVYLTDEGGLAHGYGKYKEEKAKELHRSPEAHIYEVELENVRFMDWENSESIKILRKIKTQLPQSLLA